MTPNQEHIGEETDCIILKVFLSAHLAPSHLPVGADPAWSQGASAWWGERRSADPSLIAHLSTVSSVTWALGVRRPGEASCGLPDKLFHTEQLAPGLPLRWEPPPRSSYTSRMWNERFGPQTGKSSGFADMCKEEDK